MEKMSNKAKGWIVGVIIFILLWLYIISNGNSLIAYGNPLGYLLPLSVLGSFILLFLCPAIGAVIDNRSDEPRKTGISTFVGIYFILGIITYFKFATLLPGGVFLYLLSWAVLLAVSLISLMRSIREKNVKYIFLSLIMVCIWFFIWFFGKDFPIFNFIN
ncbi:MAG: hypothetical protein JWO73_158 [Candidatus Taylorbacteria bacterium]|nr:hypothetical protein [Candidatus Taylorbacteria bacterium]